MKKFIVFLCVLCIAVAGFSTFAHAALQNNGGGLIYDTDLNITWYDYTKSQAHWPDQMAWAAGLTVGGVTGWRLPRTVDGPLVFGYDGTTTTGYNITTGEMGHLFYTELVNKGYYDTSGNGPQAGWGQVNKGPFTHLMSFPGWPTEQSANYWSGTVNSYDTNEAWAFGFDLGLQFTNSKT
jgi:hypothetical protein